MPLQDIHHKILRKFGVDLEHAIKIRASRDTSPEDIINILEDITTRTRLSRKYKAYRNVTSERSDIKHSPSTSANKELSKDVNPYKDKKFYTCQRMGHTSTSCPQKEVRM